MTTNEATSDRWLVQYELDGEWHTVATRSNTEAAKAKARAEYRAMNGAHMTAIIRESDVDAPILRRRFDFNFEIA